MPLHFHLRQLERDSLELHGEIPVEELDLGSVDELIHLPSPLRHELQVELIDQSILVAGSLYLALECECIRCLRLFKSEVNLAPWVLLLPLEGEDRVVVKNDGVDLTPFIREDILLAFPQYPLCGSECVGLPKPSQTEAREPNNRSQVEVVSSAWAKLNKLKLK